MAKKKQVESLEDKIKNYANEITVIDDVVAQVRQTPDIMIGPLGNAGFLTLTREIVQNAIDETLKGVSSDNVIKVVFDQRTHQITVEDHGRGIPHGKFNDIFGKTHSSSNYEKTPFVYSAGKNGCGASVTNMLSHKFMVSSFILGTGMYTEFNEGHIWDKGEIPILKKDSVGKQGSIISFIPSTDCLGPITTTWEEVYNLIASIIPTTPLGTTCEYTGIDIAGKQHTETIINKDGIITHLINMTTDPYVKPIYIAEDNGTMKVDIAFTYDTTVENGFEDTRGFNNTCPTPLGTHVDGALDGICKFFKEYMNKIYLVNVKSKVKLAASNSDIRTGLKLVISTFHLYAMYTGQVKEILTNKEMAQFVSQVVYRQLGEWAKSNGNNLQNLCKFWRSVIELRLKSDNDKIKLSNNFKSSALTGYPDKYVKPNQKSGAELIIVEGDSALGSARNSRDNNIQGLFPIRGKLPNVFVKPASAILSNAECSSIIQIIGGGYGKNFDISKVKLSKVIIMADADPDGGHIRTLVLRFLLMYCRALVEAGMVYASVPPLYGIPIGKNKHKFFTDKIDYIDYIRTQFCASNELKRMNGKVMTNKEVTALLYRCTDYLYELETVAGHHVIYPNLLEKILINIQYDFKTFAKNIRKDYRFMDVTKNKDGLICLEGLANNKKSTFFITNILLQECAKANQYLLDNDNFYVLNGNVCTLYEVCKAFKTFEPPKLDRYKGLGEMDPEMLAISTLRPDGDRILVRYTTENIEEEIKQMRYINSNKDVLLKDLNITRQDVF